MWQWSPRIRKIRIIHSNLAWHSLLFCETWHSHTGVDEDYALSTGEGLWTFHCKIVLSYWTVGPEDEGKLDSQQGKTSQMTNIHQHRCENFTATKCCPEASGKKLPIDTVQNPKRAQISFTPCSKPAIMQLWKCYVFCYQHAKRMHRLRLAGCFLCCVHLCAGHFIYKIIIPQQVKCKKK